MAMLDSALELEGCLLIDGFMNNWLERFLKINVFVITVIYETVLTQIIYSLALTLTIRKMLKEKIGWLIQHISVFLGRIKFKR